MRYSLVFLGFLTQEIGKYSGKYLPYEEVVGSETTDKHRPSFGTGGNQIDSDRKDLLVSTRVRTTVTCCECFKPRCVYSRYTLTSAQLEEISCLECETWYTCGSPLSPSDDPSFVVREGITCSSPVEFAYYSSKRFKNVCAHCGNECSVDTTLKDQYQTVLPLCSNCESNGKKAITRGEYKDGAVHQRRQTKRKSTAGQSRAEKRPQKS